MLSTVYRSYEGLKESRVNQRAQWYDIKYFNVDKVEESAIALFMSRCIVQNFRDSIRIRIDITQCCS